MSFSRQCSRTACTHQAVATLTYVYSDSTAVLGPLAIAAEPHSYDLCQQHADRLTAPRGWEVVRVTAPQEGPTHGTPAPDNTLEAEPTQAAEYEQRKIEISKPLSEPDDDWAALADAVKVDETAAESVVPQGFIPAEDMVRPRHAADPQPVQQGEIARRGHLRVLRGDG
ncbi:DUF3499 domain-containing protein [Timonella sp. A28]|uniref:DUF3499 domain-containing protein n=1 Tax=Timonella sp. A28 TaxID=3442640 RepID=UPI003EBC41F6